MSENRFIFRIEKDNDIPAFGAWLAAIDTKGKRKHGGEGLCLINVEAIFTCAAVEGVLAKRVLVETIAHEFAHALEGWFELEVSEEDVEKITESYRAATQQCMEEESGESMRQALEAQINGGLKSMLDAHGTITKHNYGSATKRILGLLMRDEG